MSGKKPTLLRLSLPGRRDNRSAHAADDCAGGYRVDCGNVCASLMPGKGPDGFWAVTGIGVGGALIAVVVGRFAGFWHPGDAPGFILSVVGAIMLMALYRVLTSKKA